MRSADGSRVSPCGTHHIDAHGVALYDDRRFDAVLPFHFTRPDGWRAPVCRDGRAWHITPDGQPAYAGHHERTFGFYEGLAAVVRKARWFHIRPNGAAAYARDFAFAGNFGQGRCVVSDHQCAYFHIRSDGEPAYAARWAYCGDFREGHAVVQSRQGLHTHIDLDGTLLHDQWFDDLDVFHKSIARARDRCGWFHIGPDGAPLYDMRFEAIEPFYNGCARVRCLDGALSVIDESGRVIRQLRAAQASTQPHQDAFSALSADMVGYWKTFAIAAACELGIFEQLPAESDDLAAVIGLNSDRLERLFVALWELDLVYPAPVGWQVSPRGEFLRRDHRLSLATAALEYRGDLLERWKRLPRLIRGESADSGGDRIFENVAADAQRLMSHQAMLRSYALHDYAPHIPELHFRPGDTVLDVGGGHGALSALIRAAHSEVDITVCDLPRVIAGACPTGLSRQGFDFFEPWPVNGKFILLARILHDWDDEHASRLLSRARAALSGGGEIIVFEMLRDAHSPAGGLCDLHLLAVTGGRERTLRQYERLFAAVGFVLVRLQDQCGLVSRMHFAVAP